MHTHITTSPRAPLRRLAYLIVLACVTSATAQPFTARVVHVGDGDSITVLSGTTESRLRLAEVDCPELNQPWGDSAKDFTISLVSGQIVTVTAEGHDRYGRTIAHVQTEDGADLNTELVRAGLAWHYKRYSTSTTLARLEYEARRDRRGLWKDPDPTPPWEWRRLHPER
jgi:endonuclease YncB( thermonuclease family)